MYIAKSREMMNYPFTMAASEIFKFELLRVQTKKLGLNDVYVASEADIEYRTYCLYADGSRKPPYDKLVRICGVLKLTPNDFLGFDGKDNIEPKTSKSWLSVPAYDVTAKMGGGAVIETESKLYDVTFRKEWIRTVTSAPADKLAVIKVDGDSMQPTLSPGDTVLVDMTQTYPRVDGIYAIQYDGTLAVKRVRLDPIRRTASIVSDNSMYPQIDSVNPAEISVIGRVVWLGRRV